MPYSLLIHKLLVQELEIVLNFSNLLFTLLCIISVLLSDMIEPEGGRSDLIKSLLEHRYLCILLSFLLEQVVRVNFELVDIGLNLA